MSKQYAFVKRMAELYGTLEDDYSRRLFWARIQYDVQPSMEAAIRFHGLTVNLSSSELERQQGWKEEFQYLLCEGNQIYLYGAGTVGRGICELILQDGGDFTGFCDRNAGAYHNGYLGKPVISPDTLFAQRESSYIVITTLDYYDEIYAFLIDNGVKKDHILPLLGSMGFARIVGKQYFEFPEHYKLNTAFVDGGCYDCGDCFAFSNWCGGEYSKILAFEPDRVNFEACKNIAKKSGLHGLEVLPYGLGKEASTALIAVAGGTESRVLSADDMDNRNFDYVDFDTVTAEEIQIQALDNVVGETEVGFIKLDVEGSELAALQGAEHTLLRDKPFLAVCLYHRQGDMLAVMDYLHELIPEYHFCLRHYSTLSYDTILYASTASFV